MDIIISQRTNITYFNFLVITFRGECFWVNSGPPEFCQVDCLQHFFLYFFLVTLKYIVSELGGGGGGSVFNPPFPVGVKYLVIEINCMLI